MGNPILDEKGLVKENEYIVLSFPMWRGILGYRVVSRVNKGFEDINYGPLNITDGISDGNKATGTFKFKWDVLPLERREDMFWYDNPAKLLHVFIDIHPLILRNYCYITEGVQQARYLGLVTTRPEEGYDFGYWRGEKEFFFLPFMHVAFQCYNKTNMNLYTYCKLKYGEYIVDFITEPSMLLNLMTRKQLAYWYTFPGEVAFPTDPFRRSYKIMQPFPLQTTLEEVRTDVGIILAGGTIPT